jgi:hypothetical protein
MSGKFMRIIRSDTYTIVGLGRHGGGDRHIVSEPCDRSTFVLPSCSGALLLMLHPLADEIRAEDNAEIAIFAMHEIEQRRAVEFLQMGQVQQRP